MITVTKIIIKRRATIFKFDIKFYYLVIDKSRARLYDHEVVYLGFDDTYFFN